MLYSHASFPEEQSSEAIILSVRARVRRLPKLVIMARLSTISENDPRKIQSLSAGIVKTLSLPSTFFCEVS